MTNLVLRESSLVLGAGDEADGVDLRDRHLLFHRRRRRLYGIWTFLVRGVGGGGDGCGSFVELADDYFDASSQLWIAGLGVLRLQHIEDELGKEEFIVLCARILVQRMTCNTLAALTEFPR